jgi:hypothetical protein
LAQGEVEQITDADELDHRKGQDGLGDDRAKPHRHQGQLEQQAQFLADDAPICPQEAVSQTGCHRLNRPRARRERNRNRCTEEAQPQVPVGRDGVGGRHHLDVPPRPEQTVMPTFRRKRWASSGLAMARP